MRRKWTEEQDQRARRKMNQRLSSPPLSFSLSSLSGGRIAYSNSGAELFDNTRLIRPTGFFAPPAIWSSLYAEYKHKRERIVERTAEKEIEYETSFQSPLSLSASSLSSSSLLHYHYFSSSPLSPFHRSALLFPSSLRNSYREIFGGRLQWIGVGGAASSEQVLSWMRETFGGKGV